MSMHPSDANVTHCMDSFEGVCGKTTSGRRFHSAGKWGNTSVFDMFCR